MSENTYNVAVPIYDDSEESPAKHGTVFRSSGSDPGKSEPYYWKGKALVWEDEPDAWVNNNSWGTTVYTIWNGFRWNRKFLGTTTDGPGARNTIFLPFSMSENQIKAIFGDGAKVYSIESVDAPKLKVTEYRRHERISKRTNRRQERRPMYPISSNCRRQRMACRTTTNWIQSSRSMKTILTLH